MRSLRLGCSLALLTVLATANLFASTGSCTYAQGCQYSCGATTRICIIQVGSGTATGLNNSYQPAPEAETNAICVAPYATVVWIADSSVANMSFQAAFSATNPFTHSQGSSVTFTGGTVFSSNAPVQQPDSVSATPGCYAFTLTTVVSGTAQTKDPKVIIAGTANDMPEKPQAPAPDKAGTAKPKP